MLFVVEYLSKIYRYEIAGMPFFPRSYNNGGSALRSSWLI